MWPLKRGGRCGEVAVSGGSTVAVKLPTALRKVMSSPVSVGD